MLYNLMTSPEYSGIALITLVLLGIINVLAGIPKGEGDTGCGIALFVAVLTVVISWITSCFITAPKMSREANLTASIPLTIGDALLALSIYIFWLLSTNVRICPQCKSSSIKKMGTRSESYETTKTETRTTRYYDSKRNETGHSETDYEVPSIGHREYLKFKCKKCGKTWEV